MRNRKKSRQAVSIIGGADGPTSVFVAGRTGSKKKSFRDQIRQCIYRWRRKQAAKRLRADPHTLEEVAAYMKQKYHASEVSRTKKKYIDQYTSAREGLILTHRPELLGDLGKMVRPDVWDEKAAMEMYRQIQLRSERIAQIPEDELPMDFHLYEIRIGNGRMEIGMDFQWDIFGMSYSGSKKTMKKLRKVARELYLYYGVSQEDIRNRTKRYSSLLTTLSS